MDVVIKISNASLFAIAIVLDTAAFHSSSLISSCVQVKTVNECPIQPIMMESITISGL